MMHKIKGKHLFLESGRANTNSRQKRQRGKSEHTHSRMEENGAKMKWIQTKQTNKN